MSDQWPPGWERVSREDYERVVAERGDAKDALRRTMHILENIADPYNERQGDLKRWANDALEIVRAALPDPGILIGPNPSPTTPRRR